MYIYNQWRKNRKLFSNSNLMILFFCEIFIPKVMTDNVMHTLKDSVVFMSNLVTQKLQEIVKL